MKRDVKTAGKLDCKTVTKGKCFAFDRTPWCKNANSLHTSNAQKCFKLRHIHRPIAYNTSCHTITLVNLASNALTPSILFGSLLLCTYNLFWHRWSFSSKPLLTLLNQRHLDITLALFSAIYMLSDTLRIEYSSQHMTIPS